MPTTLAWDRTVDVEPGRKASRELETGTVVGGQHEESALLSKREYSYSDALPGDARAKSAELEMVDLNEAGLEGEDVPSGKRVLKFIILPESRFRKIWVQIQMVIALYIIWVTPIRVGFDMQAQGFWFWMEGVMNIFFWADLIMNFFVAYEHPVTGELVTDHKRIAVRYLKGWFTVDLLATFPSDYLVKLVQGTWTCAWRDDCYYVSTATSSTSVTVLVALLRLMRVFRIFWIFKNFNVLAISTLIGRLQYELLGFFWVINVLELLIVLIFLGHMGGCFFYMFGGSDYWRTPAERALIEEGYMSTWVLDKFGGYYEVEIPSIYVNNSNTVTNTQVAQDPVSGVWYHCNNLFTIVSCPTCDGPPFRCQSFFGFAYRYITSMYWAYTTMTTVGYGDIYGIIIAEKVWCMVTMVVGGFFLSFCFGRMANVVGKMDAVKSARTEQMDQVTQFLKDVELPKPLTRKVLDFFRSNVKGVKPYDRSRMLEKLPFELRSKITNYLYLPTIKNVPVLKRFAEDEVFLTELCTHLQPYYCSAETFVYQKGESHGDMYILMRGDMNVLDSDKRTFLFKIPEGTVFGEGVVLRRMEGNDKARRAENVFCKTACDMLMLSPESVVTMCEHYPQLRKDLQRLDKSRQARFGLTYGRTAVWSPPHSAQPAGGSGAENRSVGPSSSFRQSESFHLTSLPGSGHSILPGQPGVPAAQDLQMLPDATALPHLQSSDGLMSFSDRDASVHRNGGAEGSREQARLAEEVTRMRQQLDLQQASWQRQMEAQWKLLTQLVGRGQAGQGEAGGDWNAADGAGAAHIGTLSLESLVGGGR